MIEQLILVFVASNFFIQTYWLYLDKFKVPKKDLSKFYDKELLDTVVKKCSFDYFGKAK